jgi:hypothetical protein
MIRSKTLEAKLVRLYRLSSTLDGKVLEFRTRRERVFAISENTWNGANGVPWLLTGKGRLCKRRPVAGIVKLQNLDRNVRIT